MSTLLQFNEAVNVRSNFKAKKKRLREVYYWGLSNVKDRGLFETIRRERDVQQLLRTLIMGQLFSWKLFKTCVHLSPKNVNFGFLQNNVCCSKAQHSIGSIKNPNGGILLPDNSNSKTPVQTSWKSIQSIHKVYSKLKCIWQILWT